MYKRQSLSVAMLESAQIASDSLTAHALTPYVLYLILALTWLQPVTTGLLADRARFIYVITYVVLVVATTGYLLLVEHRAGLLISPVILVAGFGVVHF